MSGSGSDEVIEPLPPASAGISGYAARRPPWAGVSAWVTDLSARTPLRFKLVAALLALVTVALASSGAAAAAALNGYLQDRLDAQLQSTADEVAHGLQQGPSGGRGGPAEIEASTKLFLRVMDNEGMGLGDRATGAVSVPPVLPAIDRSTAESLAREPFTVPSEGDGGNWRAVVVPLRGGGSVAVALSLDDVRSTVSRLVLIETVIGVLVLLALAGVAYAVVRSSLRPLREVEETAAAIAEGDLARRVPGSPRETEVGRLAAALNGMLAQIETAFHAREASEAAARASEDRMRRFVADASHELRTPLTSIRGFAELYRQGAAQEPADIARALRRIEDAAARMGLLVDDLLLLARLDQQRPLERVPVDLVAVVAESVAEARVLAPVRSIELTVREGVAPQVLGDEARLRQVVTNLMSNALTHTPEGTPVKVAVGAGDEESTAILSVADSGPGLSPEQAKRVFERFYRVDPSRTRAAGGSGLGLSIVAALVAAHGGEVTVETAPGQGCAFTVQLPLWRGAGSPQVGGLAATSSVEAS